MKIALSMFLLATLFLSFAVGEARCWSNGGYSDDPSHPDYGTHDWIAQHALDWLPQNEKQYILDNLKAYLYGTELPDNSQAPDGIGDTTKHHVYYYSNGTLQDDASAKRAQTEYQQALTYLLGKDYTDAAKTAGIMTHYIADVAVWAHVMGAGTDWGAETGNEHSNYEDYVDGRTSNYTDTFNHYLAFNGTLYLMSAYNATIDLARDITFDHGGIYTCTWMNNNYNVSNPVYWNRAGESLNLAVNTITNVLHTLYADSNPQPTPTPSPTPSPYPTPTPSPTPLLTALPSPTPTSSPQPTASPTPYATTSALPSATPTPTPVIPEYSTAATVTLLILLLAAAGVIVHVKKSRVTKHAEKSDNSGVQEY